jgi:hypothetical protein
VNLPNIVMDNGIRHDPLARLSGSTMSTMVQGSSFIGQDL